MSSELSARPLGRALVPALLAAASAAVLGFALVSQYGFGYAPCELCIWQRWPYAAAIALGLAGVLAARHELLRQALVALAALAVLVSGGIGVFHFGVEQDWWAGLPGCSAPVIEKGMSIEELQAVLEARSNVVPCGEVTWQVLGLSMAGWNVLVALALAGAAAWALATRRA